MTYIAALLSVCIYINGIKNVLTADVFRYNIKTAFKPNARTGVK